ncbi:hypothetical protein BJ322DRAFT_786340 [Thelephora terrestris]|uniref:NACHT domain-containing protein n=1 Tax=Thelephora terrestris TaxID=56493 RepID=A0A9P6HI35_9AGAM|nr:hypothetical protein BJ322DRAFT_786340 [Thelephora terrestris]
MLDDIELWTRDFYKPPVYWLNGLAGTGKSTIAQTIAERKFADGMLGASFFCSRDFEDRRDLRFIFPTIAAQLARKYTEFRLILIPLVRSDPEIVRESLHGQMDKLIVQPLVKSAISTVIVIDALDECKDDEPASAILSVLGQFVSQIPKVKFFVTGRPELHIREGFRIPLLAKATDVFVLHEVKPSQVQSDIRLFYKHNCSGIKSRRRISDDWPTEEQLNLLCERTAGLFVYAMATVRFIDRKNKDPEEQLERLMQSQESGLEGRTKLRANTTLDSLYMSILYEAFGDDDPEDDAKVRSVLGAVVLAANPLSPSAIATLLGFSARGVFPLLSSVHSLLLLTEDINQPVRPFHKSFPDFIVNSARCTNPRFCVSPPDQHMELLVGCLELMNRQLKRNMCDLPDGVINAEVKDLEQRTEQHVDKALQYACRSWHKHLNPTTSTQKLEITPILHRFLEEKFLFWLEVLSILGATREAVDALETIEQWTDVSRTLDLVRDYFRFVLAFFDVISTSAPHIYISALPLSPPMSIARELYKRYACPSARVVRGLPTSWDPVLATFYHEDLEGAVAWSPCSRFVAVSRLATIEILDAKTLERLNTIESYRGLQHTQLSFSPDGHTLTKFDGFELTRWDLQTGSPVGTVSLAQGLEVAFSTSFLFTYSTDGKMLAITNTASHEPGLIATYDLLSGARTSSYRAPQGRIISPLWTYGECLRFVTVTPGFFTIWEAAFTSVHTPAMIECFHTPDEAANMECGKTLFLPALSQLAFTIQATIFVWDARSSRFSLKYEAISTSHPTEFYGMSFSTDGRFFSYGAGGGEIHVWKRTSGRYFLHQRLALPRTVQPLLSPNGESNIAPGCPTIHLWHTRDQILPTPGAPVRGSGDDLILEFSPNQILAAATRFKGNTVTVVDLQSGDLRLTIDTGMRVRCLRVAGSTIAVGGEGRIVTWNLPADNSVDARASVDDSAHTTTLRGLDQGDEASISPDLSRLATMEFTGLSGRVLIHNVSTGSRLTGTTISQRPSRVALDEHEVWCIYAGNSGWGWKILEDSETGDIRLESLGTTECPHRVLLYQSLCGYKVTQDGWVLSPIQKRLLWLPHHWRTDDRFRVWSGRFFGIVHRGLPDVVILEFFE